MVGIAVYTTGLAESLVEMGHEVQVVAGKPYYPTWTVPEPFRGGWKRRRTEKGVDLTRVAHYVPANPTGARRILHHASFAFSSLMPLLARAISQNPDVVFTVAPSLIATPVAWLVARLTGAKVWLHIQDFEVEAAMATGLFNQTGTGARLARWFESFVLQRFDHISSISPAMCRKCIEKGVAPERVSEFRNWADIRAVRPLLAPSPYRAEWGIVAKHVALYSGNIANKQGIDIVVGAARRLRHRKDLMFVVCGQGPNRARLEAKAVDLDNILFRDLQPTERLGDLLGLASVHLLPQLAEASDLVLPSKLTNMLASGRAIVTTAAAGTGLEREVEGCGLIVKPGDEIAFAKAIEMLIDDAAMLQRYGVAARRRAEIRWGRDSIIADAESKCVRLCIPVD